jgi:structural maintenance of chromosome 3 (chondroitin sulfate proteoglycan 6)
VNKKAFEQYANFTKQRDNLKERREELDESRKSIEALIQHLDQRKNEAIDRTFRQVSKEFAGVFEKLVPAGMGKLIIQRKSDKERRQEMESDDDDQDTVESYKGVGISVSFNSKHDDQQRIQQLSGGQKSKPRIIHQTLKLRRTDTIPLGLCALALVFAIQRCDPAPFYLFDEIDANLDAQYRTAVANMLLNLSQTHADGTPGAQFICTTFRPEMVQVAEKCYGVSYSNKTSSIDVVDKVHALDFVEGQKQ